MTRQIFHGMQILHDGVWLVDHAVIVEEKKITAIIPSHMMQHHMPALLHHYSASDYLVPGFIDLHIHGAAGADVMDGTEQALATIAHALAAEGVTGFLATTMTAESQAMETALKAISSYQQMQSLDGAALLGVHLEGPFIAKEKMGAQFPDHIAEPNIELFEKWQQLTNNQIKIVTLAPELPGANQLITALKEANVIASLGHTDATYDQALEAIQAGCTQGTHLFNAMRGLHQREPGVAAALLLSPTVGVEVIADGVHLHPAMLSIALKLKGAQQLLLVTDAMRAKCLGNGDYHFGGHSVTVQEGKATLASGILAGSTLKMSDAIKNIVKFTGCSLIEALQMASLQPAERLGLGMHKGKIEIGYDADLVILTRECRVSFTMRGGLKVYGEQPE